MKVWRITTILGVLLSSAALAAPYTVQPKDTLFAIAKKFNVPIEVLQRRNQLTSNELKVGQILEIPERTHVVSKSETLFSIAKRYGTTVVALSSLNKLGSSGLKLGQVLLIPWEASVFTTGVAPQTTKPATSSSGAKPITSSATKPIASSQTKPATPANQTKPTSSSTIKPATPSSVATPKPVVPAVAIGVNPAVPTPAINNTSTIPDIRTPLAATPPTPTVSNTVSSKPITSSSTTQKPPVSASSWRIEPTTVLPQLPRPERPASTFPTDSNSAKPKNWTMLPSAPLPVLGATPASPPVPDPVPPENTSSADPQFSYTVVAGDTLYNIAKRFGLTVDLLRSQNNLLSDTVRIGQVLQIPQANALPSKNQDLRTIAERYLGVDYVYGGSSASGLDCSGFTSIVFREYGIVLPRTSRQQFVFGQAIEIDNLREGDLVFFDTLGSGVSHVGIYLSDSEFIHAASNPGRVIKSKLTEKYYAQRYLGARRVIRDD